MVPLPRAPTAPWGGISRLRLLGIGNTAIQVAVNPLLATIVPGERMTSYLTVGQIFRNTSLLLLAPIVTGLVALTGSWRLLLPIYAGLTVAGGVWLQLTSVPEPCRRDARRRWPTASGC